MTDTIGSNSKTIDPAAWAYEVTQSKVHAYVKLIVHTLRTLMRDRGPDIEVSDAELARCTSLSERTVSRYRTLAEQLGWLAPRVGSGRSKVTSYRISVPMQTLCELSERISELDKNTTDSPPLDGERVTASRTHSQKVTDSPTAGLTTGQNKTDSLTDSPPLKKEIPPHPLKKKINNNPPIVPPKNSGQGIWIGDDGVVHVANGKRAALQKILAPKQDLNIELAKAAQKIPEDLAEPELFAEVCARLAVSAQKTRARTKIAPETYSNDFEEFWKIYPRREGKAKASDSWERLTKPQKRKAYVSLKKQLSVLVERLSDKRGNFCPLPATWLNQGRFDDEPDQKIGAIKPDGMPDKIWNEIQCGKAPR